MKRWGWMISTLALGLFAAACSGGGGGDDDPCAGLANACNAAQDGDRRCAADGAAIETCQKNDGELACYLWTATTPCGAGSQCVEAGGQVACQGGCEDECTEGGSRCQGIYVVDCERGADGCTSWEIGENCADSGLICDDDSGAAACVAECENACNAGATRCAASVIETCAYGASGCTDWQAGQDCADDGLLCNDSVEPAFCAEDCNNICSLGNTRCLGEVIQSCVNGPQGCTVWQSGEDCADSELVCDDSEEPALCVEGCHDECNLGETYCDATRIMGCVLGADFCARWQELADCADNGLLCGSAEGASTCYRACDDQCSEGDSQCADTRIQSCVMGGEGCTVWSDGEDCADSSQVCNASSGTAGCAETCEDVCSEGDSRCSGTVVDACVRGASGCTSWEPGEDCADSFQICDAASAQCADACQDVCSLGQSRCSDTLIENCLMGELGCTTWSAGSDCADTLGWVCDESMGAAICIQGCEDACELSLLRCVDELLQLCAADGSGCSAWMDLSDCAAEGQVCDDSGEMAMCITDCGEECAAGTLRCNSSVLEHCAQQLSGCYAWTELEDCGAAGGYCDTSDGAHCSGGCVNACDEGSTRCGTTTVIQGCVMGPLDCTVWQNLMDCADDAQLCDDSAEPATCAQGCQDLCELGESRCFATRVQVCGLDADLCAVWVDEVDCADEGQQCSLASGEALCVDPCSDDCQLGDTTCQGDLVMACATGGSGCAEWIQIADCAESNQVCDDSGATPTCADTCADACSEGDSRCVGTLIENCLRGDDDCTDWVAGSDCAEGGQTCEVDAGTAGCVDGCVDECELGDSACAAHVVMNCVDGGEGCGVWNAGTDCWADDQICDSASGEAECQPLSIGWCRLQYPDIITDLPGAQYEVYGRVYIQGLSDQSHQTDAHALVLAQAGYGVWGTWPEAGGWTWFDAGPNTGYDDRDWSEPDNDEYMTPWAGDTGAFTLPATGGTYALAYRFSADGGQSWTYCDRNMGSTHDGSADGYSVDTAGMIIVSAMR